MDDKPVTLVIRLWHRPEGLRAEVKHLKTAEKQMLKGARELLHYLELAQRTESNFNIRPLLKEDTNATKSY